MEKILQFPNLWTYLTRNICRWNFMDRGKVRKMFLYSLTMLKSKKYYCLHEQSGKMLFILAGTLLHVFQCAFCLLLTEIGTLTLERTLCVQTARRIWIASASFPLVTVLRLWTKSSGICVLRVSHGALQHNVPALGSGRNGTLLTSVLEAENNRKAHCRASSFIYAYGVQGNPHRGLPWEKAQQCHGALKVQLKTMKDVQLLCICSA